MSKKDICVTALALAAMLGASDAMADDFKVATAFECKVTSGSSALSMYGVGSVTNPGSTDAWVDCPMLRDNMLGTLNYVTPTLMDRNGSSHVQCWVGSINRSDGAVTWSNPITTSYSTFWKSNQNINVTVDYDWGPYMLECKLPPAATAGNSGILSYMYSEDE